MRLRQSPREYSGRSKAAHGDAGGDPRLQALAFEVRHGRRQVLGEFIEDWTTLVIGERQSALHLIEKPVDVSHRTTPVP